jgi:hypothetical protein
MPTFTHKPGVGFLVVAVGMAIAGAISCGSSDGGLVDGGTGGADGGGQSSSGSATGPRAPCPPALPTAGSACTRDLSICEYAGPQSASPLGSLCAERAQCSSGKWTVSRRPGANCVVGLPVNAPECPATFGDRPESQGCPSTQTCYYPEGTCGCANCRKPQPLPPPAAPLPDAGGTIDASDDAADASDQDATVAGDASEGDAALVDAAANDASTRDAAGNEPSLGTQWSCNAYNLFVLADGCPPMRPLLGAACPAGLVCDYGPYDTCQIGSSLFCDRGEWSPRGAGSICVTDRCRP